MKHVRDTLSCVDNDEELISRLSFSTDLGILRAITAFVIFDCRRLLLCVPCTRRLRGCGEASVERRGKFFNKTWPSETTFQWSASDVYGRRARSSTLYRTIQSEGIDQIAQIPAFTYNLST